jgi:pimeloyl-ACP methyl ester carboxylesterase
MKKALFILLLALTPWSLMSAQQLPHPPTGKSDVREQVGALDEEFEDFRRHDQAGESMLADDYFGIAVSGHTYDKTSTIELFRSGRVHTSSLEISDRTVRVYGNTAIVTVSRHLNDAIDGIPRQEQHRCTKVWVKRNGKWQVVSFQATKIATPSTAVISQPTSPSAVGYAMPCTTATSSCTEWITLRDEPSRLLVYRSYPLTSRNENITRALLLVHGGSRDADNNFRTALAAAFLAGALNDTILIAPRFASNTGKSASRGGVVCKDALAQDEANWVCDNEPDSWRFGGPAIGGSEKLTSYDFADEILSKLAHRDVFPNLREIVVAGHSGGGIFTTRYEMANQVHDKLQGVLVTYVAANPSTVAYLDAIRPTSAAYPVTAAAPGYIPPAPADAFVPFTDAHNCVTYDDWPYGAQKWTGYAARLTDDQLKKQLAARPTAYLLGELDILQPLSGFDNSCSAMAQGPTRLARGLAFAKYVNEKYGAHHKVIIVPGCGHNARCIFTADAALSLIFPKQ